MANIFENKDRRVVPNWRSFRKTSVLGELDSINLKNIKKIKIPLSIDDYILDWQENKTVSFASDLLSAALANGLFENESVHEAADYILKHPKSSTETQRKLAFKVLSYSKPEKIFDKLKNLSIEDLDCIINTDIVRNKIRVLKNQIKNFQYNAILYVELSRNYSILGQTEKSINAMKIALFLAPENRFILRSAVRLFAHIGDFEMAHDIVRKSNIVVSDPWIMSSEIAMATIRNRSSRFIKKGLEVIQSKNVNPFNFSELASSLGTLELINGNNKKSRTLFYSSLISPNDNSLAQAEWASSKDINLVIDPFSFNINQNYEALALEQFGLQKYEEAISNACKWFIDMPFSKRPVMLGSHIAGTFLNDNEKSRSFLKAGLLAHPNDPQLLNNLVYSYAEDNQIPEAIEYLEKINENEKNEPITQICIKATRGLVYFRSNLFDQGRQCYLEAIKEAHEINNQFYNWLALLNYAREEILIKSEFVKTIMDLVYKIPEQSSDREINILKSEVLDLFKKTNN